MKIYKVTDPEFKEYGRVVEGVCTDQILKGRWPSRRARAG